MEAIKVRTTTAVEIIVTYISLGWALVMFTTPGVLVGPWELLGTISSRWLFGSLALVCALIKIVGIKFNNNRIRRIGLICSSIFWIFVSACQVGPIIAEIKINGHLVLSTGLIVYSGIAVLCMLIAREIKNDGTE